MTEFKLKKGDVVTYKGKYEKDENSITKNVTVYIEVKTDDGTEGYLRLSYCYSDEELEEGLKRIERFIKTLNK